MDYRQVPIVAPLDIFGVSSLLDSLLWGVITLGGTLFTGTKNHEIKLTLALSRNEK